MIFRRLLKSHLKLTCWRKSVFYYSIIITQKAVLTSVRRIITEEKDEEYQKAIASLNQTLTKALDAGIIPKSKLTSEELKEMWDDDNQW